MRQTRPLSSGVIFNDFPTFLPTASWVRLRGARGAFHSAPVEWGEFGRFSESTSGEPWARAEVDSTRPLSSGVKFDAFFERARGGFLEGSNASRSSRLERIELEKLAGPGGNWIQASLETI